MYPDIAGRISAHLCPAAIDSARKVCKAWRESFESPQCIFMATDNGFDVFRADGVLRLDMYHYNPTVTEIRIERGGWWFFPKLLPRKFCIYYTFRGTSAVAIPGFPREFRRHLLAVLGDFAQDLVILRPKTVATTTPLRGYTANRSPPWSTRCKRFRLECEKDTLIVRDAKSTHYLYTPLNALMCIPPIRAAFISIAGVVWCADGGTIDAISDLAEDGVTYHHPLGGDFCVKNG